MKSRLRILLVDDHDIVKEGVSVLLAARPDWQVCGEAANGREAIALAQKLRPDVVLLDITMPEMNGVDAARHIRRTLPETEVLILTMHESEQLAQEVFEAGARSLILKTDARRYLVMAIEAAARHEPFFTPRISEWVMSGRLQPGLRSSARRASANQLTAREREITHLLAEGRSTKEVAGILGSSVKTAETHRTNLMRKLGVHSVAALVRYAIRNRLIEA